ncbi:ArnT family glycosyltransferase [Nocardia farcinica]|uniref:ArnT family glycosyltransferase n=1 Tax=Nocardia farcinica TaxID=37329 RepID=UPI0015F019AC|nr:glycosyltransferase family 39 protein [Nocardia farcinica]MBA4858215.1 glycosyltransferase family 39 protein [Nocardia farcinica]MBC9817002.1 glycosyltransferase family 39 protein [Nocardia farcinica]
MTTLLSPPEHAAAQPVPRRRRLDREYVLLALLLVGTTVAYLYNLSANGWANAFYSAAVQAGSRSWQAFFFGSSDAANSITVDKPPAALWPMALSVRLFGLNSWSILVPQVLMGVGSVALLWATVRRNFGAAAGLLAGLVLAVTPVAALMFRFNNPDALLVLLMVAAAWATTRAVADGRWRWLILTGAFIGFGFLAKQLQVLLVVPALALTYLVAGPPRLIQRIAQLFAAGATMVVAAGWWLLAVELWPASSRPWIGGSQRNSIIELTLGYNGLGRLNGNETGSVGPGGELPPGGNGMWGSTGITRLFEPAQGGQIAWLIPAALVLMVTGSVLRGRAPRTDGRRAALILWGGWLVVTGLVFSFMAGIFHQYYTVALAPAVAVLVGAGAVQAWRERDRWWVRIALASAVGLTTATAWLLLSRSADFLPWLRWTVLVVGGLATVGMLVPVRREFAAGVAVAAALAGLAGPVAYTVQTVGTSHQGSIPTAGPQVSGPGGPGMGGDGMRLMGGPDGVTRSDGGGRTMPDGGTVPNAGAAPGGGAANPGTAPGNGVPGDGGTAGGTGRELFGMGGLLGAGTPSEQVVSLIETDADTYTWAAAAIGSQSAAGLQLATELPVMPIGGFNGSDPSPTLEQFQQYVRDGKIHYFIGGGRGGPGGSTSESSRISTWVEENFTPTVVDGVTLYDLTTPK